LRFGIGKENGRQQLSLDEISKKLKFTKDKIRTIESRG
jgi:DNA-directed RNA polymerase sigma subunit (sigma70/sigma32)